MPATDTTTDLSSEPGSPQTPHQQEQEDPGRGDGLVRGAATKIVDMGTKTTG